jgi:hypothetical protein
MAGEVYYFRLVRRSLWRIDYLQLAIGLVGQAATLQIGVRLRLNFWPDYRMDNDLIGVYSCSFVVNFRQDNRMGKP